LGLSGDLYFLFFVFCALALVSWQQHRLQWKERTKEEIILDSTSLISQGLLVPFAALASAKILTYFFPLLSRTLDLPSWLLFLLPLTLIDYAYYWNHRLLHTKTLWPMHRVHHGARYLDIFVTSRNSLLTPLLLVYLWSLTIFLFVLRDPTPYLWGAALSAALDLWRHSNLPTPRFLMPIGRILILPEDHRTHHGQITLNKNYGANLNIWDKIHGTFSYDRNLVKLGVHDPMPLWQKLFFPWRKT
jgi:sterol desaturase/sphingolipid hydroxylase (fatty acid hydroxylase superfamily)